MVWGSTVRFPIDEGLRELSTSGNRLPKRAEFEDALIASFQAVPLSRVIDQELDRFYADPGPVDMISRVFRRLTFR